MNVTERHTVELRVVPLAYGINVVQSYLGNNQALTLTAFADSRAEALAKAEKVVVALVEELRLAVEASS